MADYKVKSYSSYASSMSKPTSSGMSSKLDSKGYTPKSTSSSSVADKKGYTPTKSTSTASGKKYVSTYNDNYESPKTDKTKYSTTGLGAKQQPQTSKQNTEDRFANAYVSAGGTDSLGVYKPQPMNLYEKPSMKVIQDYLTGTAIQDSLYEAQGLINQATTPQMKMTTSPMTAEEIKKFVPVKELTEKGITVEQLSSMDAPTQKATLESLGITNAKFVSSSMQNMYPMSLQEFDKITMDSVHYGNPSVRDPKQSMYNTIQQPTQQGLGYNQADMTPAQPSAEQATILPNSQAMMTAPTLGEEPNLDTLSNQMLEKPVAEVPSDGLMAKPTAKTKPAVNTTYSMNANKIKNDYVLGYLADYEGTAAHSSLEGGSDTAAYGVKNSLGLKRESFKTDADFAAAVAFKHYNAAGKNFKETNSNVKVWSELGDAGRYAVTDLHYNVGTIGSTGKKKTPKAALENTLEFVGMTTKDKTKASLLSLATRRAKNWNKAADDLNLTKIDKVQQIPTKTGTTFKYLDNDNNVIYTFDTKRKPVYLNLDGSYGVLTETREEDL